MWILPSLHQPNAGSSLRRIMRVLILFSMTFDWACIPVFGISFWVGISTTINEWKVGVYGIVSLEKPGFAISYSILVIVRRWLCILLPEVWLGHIGIKSLVTRVWHYSIASHSLMDLLVVKIDMLAHRLKLLVDQILLLLLDVQILHLNQSLFLLVKKLALLIVHCLVHGITTIASWSHMSSHHITWQYLVWLWTLRLLSKLSLHEIGLSMVMCLQLSLTHLAWILRSCELRYLYLA